MFYKIEEVLFRSRGVFCIKSWGKKYITKQGRQVLQNGQVLQSGEIIMKLARTI